MSFFSSDAPKPNEPAPTRDTAADTLAEQEANLKRAKVVGITSNMLSGSGGVPTELTGSRGLTYG